MKHRTATFLKLAAALIACASLSACVNPPSVGPNNNTMPSSGFSGDITSPDIDL